MYGQNVQNLKNYKKYIELAKLPRIKKLYNSKICKVQTDLKNW